MAYPTLTPKSNSSKSILTATGSSNDVAAAVPFGIYTGSADFLLGASSQVAYTYKKLGGDILDIELKADNIYANYEEACLEYSYQISVHQAKNVLLEYLGLPTGSFNHLGVIDADGSQLSGSNIVLRYPRTQFRYQRRVGEALATEASVGGITPEYSASIQITGGVQDYDLQKIIYSSSIGNEPATGTPPEYAGKLTREEELSNNTLAPKRITIKKVYYKSPAAVWRFYGYYGGLNVVGNLNYYGQYSDDSTFEIIPTWHNKLQAMAYEDHLYTRLSHFSYELKNNRLRLYPIPHTGSASPDYVWVDFTIDEPGWDEIDDDSHTGVKGISNLNNLPFENIPYESINAIGKQWIRRYALSLSKETLGHVRGKFGSIPIPGDSVTLNSGELLSQAKSEQDALKQELKATLDEMSYRALAEKDAALMDSTVKVFQEVPLYIYQG
jgi:hypothetical protein